MDVIALKDKSKLSWKEIGTAMNMDYWTCQRIHNGWRWSLLGIYIVHFRNLPSGSPPVVPILCSPTRISIIFNSPGSSDEFDCSSIDLC